MARRKSDNKEVVSAVQKETLPHSVAEESFLPRDYAALLEDIKGRIRAAQLKAAVTVNREMIALYWDIGRSIVERQQREGWGKGVVNRLAKDLQKEFPGVSGFSLQNLWYMRSFYLAWTDEVKVLQQPVGGLDGEHLPQVVASIPWGHNLQLLAKVKDPLERLWYAGKTVEQGWSRSVLVHQIESGLFQRQGEAQTNFARTLPPSQSDLAHQTLKDPYTFNFLTLAENAAERDLQRGLLDHLRHFLIELGVGFAFVGSRYHLEVAGKDYYLDLLFYHLHLRCFVVIELKVQEFEPEHADKMNFYLSVVDDLLKHPSDQPSIGLILCKDKDRVIVEYALRDTSKPMGVATYLLRRDALPEELRQGLPSIERLETELQRVTLGED